MAEHPTTLDGGGCKVCMCGHSRESHDDFEGCLERVEGYDGMGTCPCPRYKVS